MGLSGTAHGVHLVVPVPGSIGEAGDQIPVEKHIFKFPTVNSHLGLLNRTLSGSESCLCFSHRFTDMVDNLATQLLLLK
jgi:hypothetical protein